MSGKKMQTETLTLNLGITTSLVFTIPRANLGSLKNIPYFSYPAEWNTLWDLRFQENRITFQINLKNNLLGELSPPDPMLPPFLPHPITQLPLLYHPPPSHSLIFQSLTISPKSSSSVVRQRNVNSQFYIYQKLFS